MRDKVLKRFEAGNVGVCFAYALIRQPFAVMKDPNKLMKTDWSVVSQSTEQPVKGYSAATAPSTVPADDDVSEITAHAYGVRVTAPMEYRPGMIVDIGGQDSSWIFLEVPL